MLAGATYAPRGLEGGGWLARPVSYPRHDGMQFGWILAQGGGLRKVREGGGLGPGSASEGRIPPKAGGASVTLRMTRSEDARGGHGALGDRHAGRAKKVVQRG